MRWKLTLMAYDRAKVVDAVMRLWDVGIDTQRMAHVLQIAQHDAERFLHEGLNSRWRERNERQATDVPDARR